jgi:acetolactate synthase-1/2/3 large subunit
MNAPPEQHMKLSDYVIQFIESRGIRHVFMVPGGGAMHLNDSLGQSRKIAWVGNLHEQASAMAAETYAKATGNLGVAMVTTGPGGTNAITGLAGAWLDSTPCLFISGQVKRPDLKGASGVRQMGVQEVDIISAVKAMTKYAVLVTEPESIRFHLEKAAHLATSGRPGPVWIDIPLDVQAAPIDPARLRGYRAPRRRRVPATLERDVAAIVEMLRKAERPMILGGNGIRLAGAQAAFRQLAKTLGVPVLLTWLAIDLMPHDEEILVGKPGTVAPRGVNFALQNSDFLLVIGARLDFTITGYAPERLARAARKVMVDIDAAEIAKLSKYLDLGVNCDAKEFIAALARAVEGVPQPSRTAWHQRCAEWKRRYPVLLPEHAIDAGPVSTYFLADCLSELLPPDAPVVSGSSGAGIEIFQHALRLKRGQRLYHTTALGAMGYGLPAAIGACLGSGGRETILVDGDGGFQFNIQELSTVARLGLPIKMFILNNDGYSSIRTSQQRWFGRQTGADAASGLTLPEIGPVARAYGVQAVRIDSQKSLSEQLRAVLALEGPVVCDVVSRPDEPRVPSLSSAQRADGSLYSKPLEDLWPFLPRDEFRENMIIAPLDES